MGAVLRTEGLTKRFGRLRAVQEVTLEVHEGDMYGFLGLNGAGKTTAMRMMLRLIRPTAGRVLIFGKDVRNDSVEILKRVGALVELPAYYPYLSAVRNLEILRLAAGNVPRSRIEEVLEGVGLRERMHDPVRNHSQGMRQRLGLAMALLSRPRLVLLDEPTNGLDPRGIQHIRAVIQDLNRREGVTFLISSHLLHEVEITCNRVGILKGGRLILEDTVAGILERTMNGLFLRCDPAVRAEEILRGEAWVQEVKPEGAGGIHVRCAPAEAARVNRLLQEAGVSVSELGPVRRTLEEFFLTQ